MKKETKDSVRGFIAFVVIVAGFIFMIELGYLDFLRNPNIGFSNSQSITDDN